MAGDNGKATAGLIQALSELATVVQQNVFIKTALSMDFNELKKHFPGDEFKVGVDSFAAKLDPPLASLSREVKLMLAQHHARMHLD